jgi:hypothetical protein
VASFARHRAVRAHNRVDSCVSRTVVRVVLRVVYAVRAPFACVTRVVSCDVARIVRVSFVWVTRCSRALFTRMAIVVVVLFVPLVYALFACCACVVRVPWCYVTRISHVDHVSRAVSARENKLFSLISTHVNNVNS